MRITKNLFIRIDPFVIQRMELMMRCNIKLGTIGITLVLALTACATSTPLPKGIAAEGFSPFPSIRNFDPPGRIYRIDGNGTIYQVTTLDLKAMEGIEEMAAESKTTNLAFNDVLETIGVSKAALPLSANADLERKQEFTLSSVSGKRRYLDDQQIDDALPKTLSSIKFREGNRYYLIRETIATKNLTYKSSKSWATTLGASAEFKKAISNKAKLNWDDSTNFSIDKAFDQPMDVWYKAERITAERGDAASGNVSVYKRAVAPPGEFTLSLPILKD